MSPSVDAHGERAIVDAARAGDEGALAELYNLYYPRVYRYILARMGNPYDAEDLTEEVFLRVLQNLLLQAQHIKRAEAQGAHGTLYLMED